MSPGYGTASVVIATAPTALSTVISHIVSWPHRRKHRNQQQQQEQPSEDGTATPALMAQSANSSDTLPPQQLRYEEGLKIVRNFLDFASRHTLEGVQDFTAQPVPVPHWVRRDEVTIPEEIIDKAAGILTEHLESYGPHGKGIELVGGTKWWRVRFRELQAEWIEMSKDYTRRTTATSSKIDKRRSLAHLMNTGRTRPVRDGSGAAVTGDRVILYIHGGAYFFSSLDLHRYQIQRHARKAGARAFVPNYRLSPQYPFPCGLLDSLAAYLYLIQPPEGVAPISPMDIILMGDSAGGGMCLSLLTLIREMGLPMPAAASLMSPWVDLTHSMPSILEYDGGDYIPNVGFHYKPSEAWPPAPGGGVMIKMPDGSEKLLDDQVQLYCSNNVLTHPLVSPINAGSFGGLCPLYISGGSVELLRDEVIYLAHKAADPKAYPPAQGTLDEYPNQKELVDKYPPTQVHLQIFEGACHVATTLAWTRTAKHIFRGTANFNIWAFNEARKRATGENGSDPELKRSNATSLSAPGTASSSSQRGSTDYSKRHSRHTSILQLTTADNSTPASSTGSDTESSGSDSEHGTAPHATMIKVTGTAPEFGNSPMVAERVSIHGHISLMEPVEQLPALDPEWTPKIGRIRTDGPVLKWLEKRAEWDKDFESALKKHRAIRIKNREEAEKHGFLTGDLYGENPPMCALVSLSDPKLARRVAKPVDEPTTSVSKGVALWMKLGERADEQAEEHADKRTYYRESWTDKVSRRASQIFSRDSEEKERRKSSDNRLSNGHSEKAKQVANGERRTSSEGRRPSASASAPALASGNANAITVETETEGRETARAASPSADPIADAFSKLTATPTKTPVQPPTPTVQPPTPSSGTEPAVVAVAAKDAESETTPGQSADLTPVSEPTEAASALSL